MKAPDAMEPALLPAVSPARKTARQAPRRPAPHRAATPRETPARKVTVRTAVAKDTSRNQVPGSGIRGQRGHSGAIEITATKVDGQAEILTAEALSFLAMLHHQFDGRRHALLARRHEKQARWRSGALPDFLHETMHIRASGWRVAGLNSDVNRRTSIVVPASSSAIAQALRSGARSVVVDFEDLFNPSWQALIEGHSALRDLALQPDRSLAFFIRPRGWHMPEQHLRIGGARASNASEASATLFDFGLAMLHAAKRDNATGFVPGFCLTKLESYLEARLWSDVLVFTERHFGLARGTLRVCVQIETLSAVLEIDEILFELREHVSEVVFCPRDVIVSIARRLWIERPRPLPDLDDVDSAPAMANCGRMIVRTAHRRGLPAMRVLEHGTPAANAQRISAILPDGFDGIRVDQLAELQQVMNLVEGEQSGRNQIETLAPAVDIARDALLAVPEMSPGAVDPRHLASDLMAFCSHLMSGMPRGEHDDPDVARMEFARLRLWQWLRGTPPAAGAETDRSTSFQNLLAELAPAFPAGTEAAAIVLDAATANDCTDPFMLVVYNHLCGRTAAEI